MLDQNELLYVTAATTIGMQLLFFFIAYGFQFDKVTDLAGSMNFVVLAWLTYLEQGHRHTRQLVITILVTVWGARLGGFLLYRVLQRGHDARFDEMRSKFFQFLSFWIFQMVWVWVVSLPVIFLNAAEEDASWCVRDVVGLSIWGIGFIFEVTADQTKYYFNKNPANKGKLLQHGVYSCTRHPNYFGEIAMWIGIFISCTAAFDENSKSGYVSILSPAFTYLLLVYASGVKMTTARYEKRFRGQVVWAEYKRTTPILLPFPGCLFSCMPGWAKWLFCCEYRMFALDEDGTSPLCPDRKRDSNEVPAVGFDREP